MERGRDGSPVTTSSREAPARSDRAVQALRGWDARALDLSRETRAAAGAA